MEQVVVPTDLGFVDKFSKLLENDEFHKTEKC